MEAEYTISENDYLRAMKLYAKITPKVAASYILAVAVLAIVALFGPMAVKAGVAGGLIGGAFVIVVGRFFIGPFITRRNYRKYKAIHEPIHVQLKEEGVAFSTVDASGVVRWEKIFKWRQNEHFLLIYPMPRLFHIIPKSIANSGFDLSSLINILESKVGKEA